MCKVRDLFIIVILFDFNYSFICIKAEATGTGSSGKNPIEELFPKVDIGAQFTSKMMAVSSILVIEYCFFLPDRNLMYK